MAETLLAIACAWLAWCALNFLLMLAFSAFYQPTSAQFDGFRVRMPDWLSTALTRRELMAFRQHEEGHRFHMHPWQNYLRVCLFVGLTPADRRQQEYEADDFCDDPSALASAIRKTSNHPFDLVRAARLEKRVAAVFKVLSDGMAKLPMNTYVEGQAGCLQPYPRDAGLAGKGEGEP